jgi:hypothetical protein
MVPCERCGGNVDVELKQGRGMTGQNVGTCASCGKVYLEMDLETMDLDIRLGKVPAVDALKAARMLRRPGEASWAAQELRAEAVPNGRGGFDYPLTSVRAYADAERNRIDLVPLDAAASWVRTR